MGKAPGRKPRGLRAENGDAPAAGSRAAPRRAGGVPQIKARVRFMDGCAGGVIPRFQRSGDFQAAAAGARLAIFSGLNLNHARTPGWQEICTPPGYD